jgi:hypothetical protein
MGAVYVLINPSLPSLVKIGYTERNVEKRIEELSNTSLPSEFILVYQVQTNSPREVESAIHRKLDSLGFRINTQREFFNAPIPLVIDSLIEICASEMVSVIESPLDLKSNLELAFDYLWGRNSVFKDADKAKQLLAIEYQKKNFGAYYPYCDQLSKSELKKYKKKILIEAASNGCLKCSIRLVFHFAYFEFSMDSFMKALSIAFNNYNEKTYLNEPFISMHKSYGEGEDSLTKELFEIYFEAAIEMFNFFDEKFNLNKVPKQFIDFGRAFEAEYENIFNNKNKKATYEYGTDEENIRLCKYAREIFFRLVTSCELSYSEYETFVADLNHRDDVWYIH